MATYDEQLTARLRHLGAAIRNARLQGGLSQEQLADLAGVHRTYVGSVERGERNISIGSVYAFSDALNVSAADLIPT